MKHKFNYITMVLWFYFNTLYPYWEQTCYLLHSSSIVKRKSANSGLAWPLEWGLDFFGGSCADTSSQIVLFSYWAGEQFLSMRPWWSGTKTQFMMLTNRQTTSWFDSMVSNIHLFQLRWVTAFTAFALLLSSPFLDKIYYYSITELSIAPYSRSKPCLKPPNH
jgi:hypothetical protein